MSKEVYPNLILLIIEEVNSGMKVSAWLILVMGTETLRFNQKHGTLGAEQRGAAPTTAARIQELENSHIVVD